MFSIKNSYDYKNQYNDRAVQVPFTGDYESLDNYKFIYIYGNSVGAADVVTVEFTNKKNDIGYEINEDVYTMTTGVEKEIIIPKKLRYFRVKIALADGDTFDATEKRIYNVYLLDTQYQKSSGGGTGSNVTIFNEDGDALTTTSSAGKVALDCNLVSSALPTGASTSANQVTQTTHLSTIASAVSGTEMQVDVVSSALPTDAATATNQALQTTQLENIASAVVASEMQVNVVSSALPTDAATSANQVTQTTHLENIASAVVASEMQVNIVSSALPTDAATELTLGGIKEQTDRLTYYNSGSENYLRVDLATAALTTNLNVFVKNTQESEDINVSVQNTDLTVNCRGTSDSGISFTTLKTDVDGKLDVMAGLYDSVGNGITSTAPPLSTMRGIDANIINTDLSINCRGTSDSGATFTTLKTDVDGKLDVTAGLYDLSGNGITSTSVSFGAIRAIDTNITNNELPIRGTVYITDPSGNAISKTNPLTTTENYYDLHRDAFNRLRVSHPFTLFDSRNVGKLNNRFTGYPTLDAGIVYNQSSSTISMNASVSNPIIIRESKNRFSYQPGKSLLILNTFVFDASMDGIQRVGYFDDENGIYLEYDDTEIKLGRRSCSSGSIVDVTVPLADWNGDAVSIATLDLSKVQIFWIDIEWLGSGSVRTGFVLSGKFILAHTFHHANVVSTTYMTSAQLPVRYEIRRNTNDGTMVQICSSVVSEGGFQGTSVVRSVGVSLNSELVLGSSLSVDTQLPICGIRISKDPTTNLLYNSIVLPSQMYIYLNNTLGVVNSSMPIVEYKVVLNPTSIATWSKYSTDNPVDASSTVETTKLSTIVSVGGGLLVNSGFLEARSLVKLGSPTDFNLQLGRRITGMSSGLITYDSDELFLMLKCVYPGSSASITNVAYKLGWYEL